MDLHEVCRLDSEAVATRSFFSQFRKGVGATLLQLNERKVEILFSIVYPLFLRFHPGKRLVGVRLRWWKNPDLSDHTGAIVMLLFKQGTEKRAEQMRLDISYCLGPFHHVFVVNGANEDDQRYFQQTPAMSLCVHQTANRT